MWIKSSDNNIHLGSNVWISMNHITHFAIRQMPTPNSETNETYGVEVYLNASEKAITTPRLGLSQDQTSVLVYRGTEKKCQQFIIRKLRRQSISQWIGYLVAGGLGAVLAAVLTVVLTGVFPQS